MLLLSAMLALSLALVHFFSGRLSPLQGTPRSRWLSLAGGVAVAYVFVHLLPDLSEAQRAVEEVSVPLLDYLRHHVYLVALLGLVAFYGLERAAKVARERQRGDSAHDATFWFHIGFFALYNAFIGYLVFYWEPADVGGLFFFSFAIALHFLVNDYGLRHHHEEVYDRTGRWILAVAIIGGWSLGNMFTLHEAVLGALFAFIAGAVIFNVLKEELPEERESRYWAFALGATVYALMLILI